MKHHQYFKDQRFMLMFCHWSRGTYVDAEDVSLMVTDGDGRSLVISARSNELMHPGDCFLNSAIFDEEIAAFGRDLFSDHNLFPDDESLLVHFQSDRALSSLDSTEELGRAYVKSVRDVAKMAERPFASHLLVLAYDDEEEVEAAAPILLIKRGGFELVAEFLLSGFTGGSFQTRSEDCVQFVCDDGETQLFDLSQNRHPDFSWLRHEDEEFDAEGIPRQFKRSIFNMNESALDTLASHFAIPTRVERVLTDAQRKLLRDQVPGELLVWSDFLGLELFQQRLPNAKVDNHLATHIASEHLLATQSRAWDEWAQSQGVVPPNGDSRW